MPKAAVTRAASPRRISQRLADLGEFGVIDLIKRLLPLGDPDVVVGIGDDTAVLRTSPGRLLLATCDIQLEGHHFRRDRITAEQLGRRVAAVNLSDIAAMGGTPRFALASLGLPPELPTSWVEELYGGLRHELSAHGACVVGGNLAASERILLDLTLLGEVAEAEVMRRNGARPGDLILVTGSLGNAAAGLLALEKGLHHNGPLQDAVAAHLTPVPRVSEGRAIARWRRATSMIDISDGLASDLRHLCQASPNVIGTSGLSATLWAERLPVAQGAQAAARLLGLDATDLAVRGGEDYELLFTAAPGDAGPLVRAVQEATGTPVTVIGEVGPGPYAMCLRLPGGRRRRLQPEGWDHFRKARSPTV